MQKYIAMVGYCLCQSLVASAMAQENDRAFDPRKVLIEYCDGTIGNPNPYETPKCVCIADKLQGSANAEMIKRVYISLLPVGQGGTVYSPLTAEDKRMLHIANNICAKETAEATVDKKKEKWFEIARSFCGGAERLSHQSSSEFCECYAKKMLPYMNFEIANQIEDAVRGGHDRLSDDLRERRSRLSVSACN